jgi:hypothetical protein
MQVFVQAGEGSLGSGFIKIELNAGAGSGMTAVLVARAFQPKVVMPDLAALR